MPYKKITHISWREKILLGFHEIFRGKSPTPDSFSSDSIEMIARLFESGMFPKGNFWHRQIFGKIAPKVRVDEVALELIKQRAKNGTLVFITPHLGQLEFNLFNYIAYHHKLPVAHFNNRLRVSRWIPYKQHQKIAQYRLKFLRANRILPDPIYSNFLSELVMQEKSALLSLDSLDPEYISAGNRELLLALFQAQQKSQKPIYLVPQQLVWDKRPPREEPTLVDTLFGVVENPGWFRKLILLLRHYRQRSIVQFGEPIDLRECSLQSLDDLYRKIIHGFYLNKRALTGPPIRPRSWFVEQVAEDKELEKTLYLVAKEKQKELGDLKRLVTKYTREISSDISVFLIDLCKIGLNWIFNRLYQGIECDPEEIKKLKKALTQGPVILVPNHRSHVDYLLIAHLCHQNNIVTPQTAAGINLSFWPLGPLFRRTGAFFLRRTFHGNPIYKQVFHTYLKILIREGYLQEFFIEGGRSRTGKLLNPKLGMLSMYTQAMMEGAAPDIQFVPICITYEKVIEQKAYAQELEGKPKEKEKTRDLLQLRRYIRGNYGRIHVCFDDPISWQEIAKEETNKGIAPADQKSAIAHTLANKIMHAINRQTVVTSTSLVCSTLLAPATLGLTRKGLYDSYKKLLDYLLWKGTRLSPFLKKNPDTSFAEVLEQLKTTRLIREHEGLEGVFYEISPSSRIHLDFYKNTIVHYFVSLSLWSSLLLRQKTEQFLLIDLVDDYSDLQKLFQFEFRFSTRLTTRDHLDKLCQYLAEKKAIHYTGTQITLPSAGKPQLKDFKTLLESFVESYWIAAQTCFISEIERWPIKELIRQMHRHGKHLLILGRVKHSEALSQANFENTIASFVELNILANHEKELGSEGRKILSRVKNFELEKGVCERLEKLMERI